jgi:uncharacterized protein
VRILIGALALAVVACGQQSAGANAPAERLEIARVDDRAKVLDVATEQSLTQKLAALEAATSDQFAVITVPTLEGKAIEQYSLDLVNSVGLGRADLDNGVLLLVAPNERRVRIEVGLGLEGLLTDADAAKIIQQMIPVFRGGRLQDAVSLGVDSIDRKLRSDVRRPQPRTATVKEAA